MMDLTWSAIARTLATSVPVTRNCTGYGTGGPFGSSFTLPRTSGKSFSKTLVIWSRSAARAARSLGSTTICDTLVCGKI